jgi:hypothetical protein
MTAMTACGSGQSVSADGLFSGESRALSVNVHDGNEHDGNR